MPTYHKREQFLDEYLAAAGIRETPAKSPLRAENSRFRARQLSVAPLVPFAVHIPAQSRASSPSAKARLMLLSAAWRCARRYPCRPVCTVSTSGRASTKRGADRPQDGQSRCSNTTVTSMRHAGCYAYFRPKAAGATRRPILRQEPIEPALVQAQTLRMPRAGLAAVIRLRGQFSSPVSCVATV